VSKQPTTEEDLAACMEALEDVRSRPLATTATPSSASDSSARCQARITAPFWRETVVLLEPAEGPESGACVLS